MEAEAGNRVGPLTGEGSRGPVHRRPDAVPGAYLPLLP